MNKFFVFLQLEDLISQGDKLGRSLWPSSFSQGVVGVGGGESLATYEQLTRQDKITLFRQVENECWGKFE